MEDSNVMNNQPVSPEKRHSTNLLSAVEVMSAIIEGYSGDENNPDSSLAEYITNQMMVGEEDIPKPIWNLLGGFATLNHLLLTRVEELSHVPKQASLGLYAGAAKTVISGP
jgi:hypothetical protein